MCNLYTLCVGFAVFVVVSCIGVPAGVPAGIPGEPECSEDCDVIMERFFTKFLAPQLVTLMPFIVEMPEGSPCKICNFSKLETVAKNGPACAQEFPGGYRQKLRMVFKFVNARCECEGKDPQGQASQFILDSDWKEGLARVSFQFIDNKCTVLEGSLDCENPQPKCMLDPATVDIRCEADDENAKKACEDSKGQAMNMILQVLVESAFPGLANGEVNKRPDAVNMINCQDDE